MIDEIRDNHGVTRRLGSLTVPDGFVSAFADYSSEVTPYDDSDIRKLLQDPKRVPSRVTFGSKWTVNQANAGSCNGWLAAQLLHKGRWLRGIQDGLILSGSFVYSLINGGQDNGSVLEHGMRKICEAGAPPASIVTPSMIYPWQQPKSAVDEAAKHKGFNPLRTSTVQQVRTALAQQIPVGIAIHAGRNFQRLNAKGIGGVDNGIGNHAVVADDLVVIDGTEYMDVQNSWGNQFGVEGRVYLPLDSIAQTMSHHVFYVLMSTEEAQ